MRRLKYYGLGFGIGIVFVFFFFRNRGCTWLPENRVKNTILGRVLVVSEEQDKLFHQKGLTKNDLIHFLNDGDVDFGSSKKQGNPQVYTVTKTLKGKDVTLWFTLPKDAFIAEVRVPKGNIQKATNTVEGLGKMIYFPKVENLVFLDDNNELIEQKAKLSLTKPKQVQKALEQTGILDFSESKLKHSPYPEQYVRFTTKKGAHVAAKTIWYQEHIQFDSFIISDSL